MVKKITDFLSEKRGGVDDSAIELIKGQLRKDHALATEILGSNPDIDSIDLGVLRDVFAGNNGNPALFNKLTARIAMTLITSPQFKNPLDLFMGDLQLGEDIQDIYVDMVPGEAYDPNSTELFEPKRLNTEEMIYRNKFNRKYSVSVSQAQMLSAFRSENALSAYIAQVISRINVSQQVEEFGQMLKVIMSAIVAREGEEVGIEDGNKEDFYKALTSEIKIASDNLVYGSIANMNKVFMTTPKEDQILLISTRAYNEMTSYTYSGAFNLEQLQLDPELIRPVPSLGVDSEGNEVLAVLADRKKWLFFRTLDKIGDAYNPDTLEMKYIHHFWANFARSAFRNMVVFVKGDIDPDENTIAFSSRAVMLGDYTDKNGDNDLRDKVTLTFKTSDYADPIARLTKLGAKIGVLGARNDAEAPDISQYQFITGEETSLNVNYLNVKPDLAKGKVDVTAQLPGTNTVATQMIGLFDSDDNLIDQTSVVISSQ